MTDDAEEAALRAQLLPPMSNLTDPNRISLMPKSDFRYLDDALSDIFEAHGQPRLGGASGRGWSSISTFQKCPYLFKAKYIDGARGPASPALETGSAFHTFLALHYRWMREDDWVLNPYYVKELILKENVRTEPILEAWRLYQAYAAYYEKDYLIPLAEEEWAGDPDGNTCRYDAIFRVDDSASGLVPGTYIGEHKTAARFTADALEGWRNDGEIWGQIMIWKRSGLDKKYGKLRGTIVNIVGKQKVIQFHRTIISAQKFHVATHMDDLKVWSALQRICEATGTWPRSRSSCTGKYGMCEMFEFCAENRKPSKPDVVAEVQQLVQLSQKRRGRKPKVVEATPDHLLEQTLQASLAPAIDEIPTAIDEQTRAPAIDAIPTAIDEIPATKLDVAAPFRAALRRDGESDVDAPA